MTNKINHDEILESAKKIMNNFMKELEKCKDAKEQFGQIRATNKREFVKIDNKDHDFINRMFNNAKSKKDNYIIAEKQKRDE